MKRVFLVLSVVILLTVLYVALINIGNYAEVNILAEKLFDSQSKINLSVHNGYYYSVVKVATLVLLTLVAGIFTGAGTVYLFLSAQKEKVKAYQRELEKTSISGLNNASRVEVLEAKIKTLEKAFNTVADERTQLEVQIKNLNNEIESLNKRKN